MAVFRKTGGEPLTGTGRIADHVPAVNIHDKSSPDGAPLRAELDLMPDMKIADDLRVELTEAHCGVAGLSAELATARQQNDLLSEGLGAARAEAAAARAVAEGLRQELAAAVQQLATAEQHLQSAQDSTANVETALADVARDLLAIQNSRSWRLTAGVRWLSSQLRGR